MPISINITTHRREEFVNITSQVESLVRKQGWQSGVLTLFCLHTTAGLTVNEAADPSVVEDTLAVLRELIPHKADYRHQEGNSDAHVKASLMGPSLQIIVEQGKLQLGTWQGIFFTEFDGPRTRTALVKWIAG